ncbi:hypothetical protein EV401DRAFT_1986254, partial [Pisolithus croceorrhizus]
MPTPSCHLVPFGLMRFMGYLWFQLPTLSNLFVLLSRWGSGCRRCYRRPFLPRISLHPSSSGAGRSITLAAGIDIYGPSLSCKLAGGTKMLLLL